MCALSRARVDPVEEILVSRSCPRYIAAMADIVVPIGICSLWSTAFLVVLPHPSSPLVILSRFRSKNESFQQLSMAVEHGINFFDTAEMYPVPQRAATQVRSTCLDKIAATLFLFDSSLFRSPTICPSLCLLGVPPLSPSSKH